MIDGNTRTCGLVGDPVQHTLSPIIQNTLSLKYVNNLVYVPFHVQENQILESIKGAYALNILGLNVTYPFKSQVISCLTEIDELAKKNWFSKQACKMQKWLQRI